MNDKHKDKSPSMVDKVARTSQQKKQQKYRLFAPLTKWKERQGSSSIPKIIAQKGRRQEAKKSHCRCDKRSETQLKKATKILKSNEVQLWTNNGGRKP